jgi:hypothetical protein
VPLHPLVAQVQLLRRPGDQEEPVVGDGGLVEFRGGRRTDARRLQEVGLEEPLEEALEPYLGHPGTTVRRWVVWAQGAGLKFMHRV